MTQPLTSIAPVSKLGGAPSLFSFRDVNLDVRGTLKFQPHEHLYFQGDTPNGVFQVLSGTVILYKLMPDGRRQIQQFASAGDCLALTFSDEHDVSAEALTPVETVFLPQAAFERALQADPSFRRKVFDMIGQMLRSAREQALLLGRKSAMERTASFLMFLEDHFSDATTGLTAIRMSRCDIADYLGLTLETVSRMLNRLKKQGVIDLPCASQFNVIKPRRLSELSGESEASSFAQLA